jgi:isopentenyl diphosphate isomerase/L-lactate dehydrogenase-like FMN-dependent dehydrogenase
MPQGLEHARNISANLKNSGENMTIKDLLRDGNEKLEKTGFPHSHTPDPASSAGITRAYFDSLLVELRVLDSAEASTEMRLFGESFATPVMTAALSGLDKVHPGGMAEVAKGAAAAGAVMWAGIGGEDELKAMIDTGAKVIKIVKPYTDTDMIFAKLAQAERHGAFAVGMDIDFFFGRRTNVPPPFPMSPKTSGQIKSYIQATGLPFILKGVLSTQDAAKALELGAAGIVLSHHGGIALDYAVPPVKILPDIVRVIERKIPIFVDCGITRGMDAFKALALGAGGVSVGRAVMAGLASAGAEGVKNVLESITLELKRTMSITGSPDLGHIDPRVIRS